MENEIKGLGLKIREQIVDVITAFEGVKKVALFGSRATDSFERTSDIDLAVFGENLTHLEVNLIKANLEEEVKTPLKIDLVHFDAVDKEELKDDILSEGIIIYES